MVQLVDAVIENLFGSRNTSRMSELNNSPNNTPVTNNILPPQDTINFNPDDRLLNKLEETLQKDLDEASGYDVFNPLPIFVMVGIIACGIIVLAVYCTVRYKILRICCKPNKNSSNPQNDRGGPVDQPATTDSSCSEGEQTPAGGKKNGKRPKALQKATIANPYPTLNARLGIKTSSQQRSETIVTGSQGMNALRWENMQTWYLYGTFLSLDVRFLNYKRAGRPILKISIFARKCPKLTKYRRGRGNLCLLLISNVVFMSITKSFKREVCTGFIRFLSQFSSLNQIFRKVIGGSAGYFNFLVLTSSRFIVRI